MKKIIYLLMSLSFAALVSCDDNDKTSSSNSSEMSAEDMKKMAGKTLVIKTKCTYVGEDVYEDVDEYVYDNNGRLSKIIIPFSDGSKGVELYGSSMFPTDQSFLSQNDYDLYLATIIEYSDEHSKLIKQVFMEKDDNGTFCGNDTSVYECYYEKGRLVSCYESCCHNPRKGEYEYEYDTNGNPVKVRDNHWNEEMTLTYTDIKVSELPIEDRLALSETTKGESKYVAGEVYTDVVYCNPELTSCWRGALANTLLKKVEDKYMDENCTLNWTYYLNDKRVSISCYDDSGEFRGTIEYSWYLK